MPAQTDAADQTPEAAARRRRQNLPPLLVTVATLCVSLVAVGCGMTGGALLFHLGAGRGQRVDAEYAFGEAKVAILVDDFDDLLEWPQTRTILGEELREELRTHRAVQSVMPISSVQQLRQERPDFDRRGCREIGDLLGADQVLWLQIRDFHAAQEVQAIQEVTRACRLSVAVKVIDTHATERAKVRLYPDHAEGKLVTVEMSASEVSRAKDQRAIIRALTGKLATRIARLFYRHPAMDDA